MKSISEIEFNNLFPYQPHTTVEVNSHTIKVRVFNCDGEVILIKQIGILVNITTYYTINHTEL